MVPMTRRLALALLVAVLAASCVSGPTEPPASRTPAGILRDEDPPADPPPPDTTGNTQNDTTGRGGGTLGSGT